MTQPAGPEAVLTIQGIPPSILQPTRETMPLYQLARGIMQQIFSGLPT